MIGMRQMGPIWQILPPMIFHSALEEGQEVVFTDGKRKIPVEIRRDIRPNRTALAAFGKMV